MTQKKYPAYKPSGVEWVGEIPSHWVIHRLKQLADKGSSTFIDGDWIESKNITTSGVRYITTGNIGSGKYREQGTSYISEKTFKELRCTELFPGDMVLSRLFSPIGRSCILPNLGVRVVTSVDNVIFRPNKDCHKPYLNYYFNWIRYNESNDLMSRGTTLERISRTMLGNNPVLLPPLPEQQAIASYLDQKTDLIDSTIRQKERLIELLQEERTAIINRAVTRGLDPNVPMKDSGVEWIAEIPEHWVTKPLKRVVEYNSEVIPESTDEDEVIHYIEISDVDCNRGVHNSTIYTFKDAPSRARRIVRSGDTLISTVRTYLKAVGIVESKHNGYIASTGFCVLRPKHFNHRFQGYLGQSRFIEEVSRRSVGVSYPAINATDLVEIEVPHPPLSEQQAIASYLDQKTVLIDDTILKNRQQISALTEYGTALINEVVTGKRCVT